MAALLSLSFSSDGFRQRQIKLSRWKSFRKSLDIGVVQNDDKIHIVSETRFPIKNGGHAAGDNVANARVIQRTHEQQERFNWS